MSIYKAKETFIGNGAGNASAVDVTVGAQLSIITPNGTTIAAGAYNGEKAIQITNRYANGDLKVSNKIKVGSLTNGQLQPYAPAKRCVVSIGYNRSTGAGNITLPNSIVGSDDAEYRFRLVFTNDKSMYSERGEALPFSVNMRIGQSRLETATAIARVLNTSGYASAAQGVRQIEAVVVTGGGGEVGVEITGLDINQFSNTQYAEEFPQFEVYLDNTSEFGTPGDVTPSAKIQASHRGVGTYAQAFSAENYSYGALNRTLWPIPDFTYLASNTGTVLTTGLTLAVTAGSDYAVFSGDAVAAGFVAGSIITIDGIANEIKYIVAGSTTDVVLVTPAAATAASATVTAKTFYAIISIGMTDVTIQDGAGVGQFSSKHIEIFTEQNIASAMPGTPANGTVEIATFLPLFYGPSSVEFLIP